MRPTGFLLVLASVGAVGACENDFYLREIAVESPPQVSLVSASTTSGGALIVHWSAVDEALRYAVFVSTVGDLAGEWVEECDASPCVVTGLEPGQLYYVRVATASEEIDPNEDLERTAEIQDLSVRAGFPGQRGPFAWAGTALLAADGESVSLHGMWFEDGAAPSSEHSCYTYWEDEPVPTPTLEPCTNAALAGEGTYLLGSSCKRDVCHPVLEVQAGDGRYGQAFTRVVVP